jgi:hypothetical protein
MQWPEVDDSNLDAHLENRLSESYCGWPPNEQILDLWSTVSSAEAADYLGHQLADAGLQRAWNDDALPILRKLTCTFPLSEVRYFVWAAVRAGSAAFLRYRGDERMARDAIVRDLAQRPIRASSERWNIRGFSPNRTAPFSLIAEAVARLLLPSETTYWNKTPCLDALLRDDR